TQLRFEYTDYGNSSTTYFQQPQFDVLNYPSIGGSYMYMSGGGQQSNITNAGNTLAAYYNDFGVGANKDYPTYSDPQVEAARINDYVNSQFTSVHPTWVTLNEVSKTLWRDTS